jgi:hypothetical protein
MGQRAIAHMNYIHGQYRIANEDYLFVLSTFVFYPINWINRYGWRKLTPSEELAFFYFFREVGRRMNLTDIPESIDELRTFTDAYEQQHFRYTESNRRIAEATVTIVKGWFPAVLHPIVRPTVSAMINDRLRVAFGYERPANWYISLIDGALWIRKWPLRWLTFKPYPSLVSNTSFRYYPQGAPEIEAVGPEHIINRKSVSE